MRIGSFEIEVSRPYPCWCTLKRHVGGGTVETLGTFAHSELRDLEYAVSRMIFEAQQQLCAAGGHDRSKEV